MKKLSFIFTGLIFSIFLISCEKKVEEKVVIEKSPEPSGKIVKLQGDVFAVKEDKKELLKVNSQVFVGDTIESGKSGLARVVFSDGGVVAIGADSSFSIDEYFYDDKRKSSDINIKKGMFEVISGKIGKANPDKFKLKAKTATMGIRGTHIVGNIQEGKPDLIACIDGAIYVEVEDINGNKVKVDVEVGQKVDVDPKSTKALVANSVNLEEIKNIVESTGLDNKEEILENNIKNLNINPKISTAGDYYHLNVGFNTGLREGISYSLDKKIPGVSVDKSSGKLKVLNSLVEKGDLEVLVSASTKDYKESKKYTIKSTKHRDWVSLKSGEGFVIGLKADGTLWSWGRSNKGALGLGYKSFVFEPTLIYSKTPFASFDIGDRFVVAVKKDGTLWSWGDNTNGKLGLGNNQNRDIPTQIGKETNWEKIAVGYNHSLAITKDGALWSWGENIAGKLGTGNSEDSNLPIKISSKAPWKEVVAGEGHSLGIKSDGTLWSWGSNEVGQLGVKDTLAFLKPEQISKETNWKKVYANSLSSFALKTDGTLWSWGDNELGLLGQKNYETLMIPTMIKSKTQWTNLFAGNTNIVGQDSNGDFWGWGQNKFSEIKADKRPIVAPLKLGEVYKGSVSIGENYILGVTKDSTLKYKGSSKYRTLSGKAITVNSKNLSSK